MEQQQSANTVRDQPKRRAHWSRIVVEHFATFVSDWMQPTLQLQPKPRGYLQARLCGRVRLLDNNPGNPVFAARFRRTWTFESVLAERFSFSTVEGREAFVKSTSVLLDAKQDHVQWILGTCIDGLDVYVIRPLLELRSAPLHLQSVPTTDRRQLVIDAAQALCFLHTNNIVHGDVKLENLLIAPSGLTLLSGFALLQPPSMPDLSDCDDLTSSHVPYRASSDSDHSIADNPRWRKLGPSFSVVREGSVDKRVALSAQLHLRSNDQAGDLFAFGFLLVEVFTGVASHQSPSALALLRLALSGKKPPSPGRFAEVLGLDVVFWDLCQRLWRLQQPTTITAHDMLQIMSDPPQNIIRSPYRWNEEALVTWSESAVASLTGKIRDIVVIRTGRDIEHALYEIQGTWYKSAQLSQTVKLVHPSHCRRGLMRRPRVFLAECFVWSQLHHENILPLLGTAFYAQEKVSCFVVPWMEGGTCVDYLSTHPAADRFKIQLEVAAALQYLHSRSPSIIHGDLRAHSVWMSEAGHAFIANFDFTPIDEPNSPFDISDPTSVITYGRYAPPEGMSLGKKSDVFSFGFFSYELYSGRPPYYQFEVEDARHMIRTNQRPDRPECSKLTDEIWDLMQRCWRHSLPSRPSMRKVLSRLQEISSLYQAGRPEQVAWNMHDMPRLFGEGLQKLRVV